MTSKNEVMRKQTLEQAFFFFKGEVHQLSVATRNSDAWEVAGVCWKTKLNPSSYLPTAKCEKAEQGKAGKDIVC